MYNKSSINWPEVKRQYISDTRYSYAVLADMYGVSKATIQKKGTAEKWLLQRIDFQKELDNIKLHTLGTRGYNEVNTRHLSYARTMQSVVISIINQISKDIQNNNSVSQTKHIHAYFGLLNKTIRLERKILGMTKKHSALALSEIKESKKTKLSKSNTFFGAAERADILIEGYLRQKGLRMLYVPITVDEDSIGAVKDPFNEALLPLAEELGS